MSFSKVVTKTSLTLHHTLVTLLKHHFNKGWALAIAIGLFKVTEYVVSLPEDDQCVLDERGSFQLLQEEADTLQRLSSTSTKRCSEEKSIFMFYYGKLVAPAPGQAWRVLCKER